MTLVPRTCAVRQALEAWGQQQPVLPLLVGKPGRTKDEACRRWHGPSVFRSVEVKDSEGRVTQEELRFIVVHSSQLAQQQAQSDGAAQAKEAEAVAEHARRVHARWFACLPDAEAAIAEYEGGGRGRRGRRPRPWRYHTVRYGTVAATRHTRRARRGRPAKTDPPPTESGYRVAVEVEVLSHPRRTMGGPSLPRPYALREARMPRFFRPIKTRIRPWKPVFVGSRPPRPLPPCGWRNLNGLPPWRCSPSSACWSTASSSGRCVCTCARMPSRAQGTKA